MISIIIPAYNEEKYLPNLLECIKRQTYRNYEIIVADADSTDNTRLIAQKYGCRVVNGGLPAASRNSGAGHAKGSILLFMDADVEIERNFLKQAICEFAERKLDAAACYITPSGSRMIDVIFFHLYNSWTFMFQLVYPQATAHGIFCSKKLHKKINGFDETIRITEDADYVNRCSKSARFRMLRKPRAVASVRRFEREGRIKLAAKLAFLGLYRIFFGDLRKDLIPYDFRYRK